jgi:hypothetical protein
VIQKHDTQIRRAYALLVREAANGLSVCDLAGARLMRLRRRLSTDQLADLRDSPQTNPAKAVSVRSTTLR